LIRLYTDASFIVRGRKAQIGLAVTVSAADNHASTGKAGG